MEAAAWPVEAAGTVLESTLPVSGLRNVGKVGFDVRTAGFQASELVPVGGKWFRGRVVSAGRFGPARPCRPSRCIPWSHFHSQD